MSTEKPSHTMYVHKWLYQPSLVNKNSLKPHKLTMQKYVDGNTADP